MATKAPKPVEDGQFVLLQVGDGNNANATKLLQYLNSGYRIQGAANGTSYVQYILQKPMEQEA